MLLGKLFETETRTAHIEMVPPESVNRWAEYDGYLYHVTTEAKAGAILRIGFIPNSPAVMTPGFYRDYSKGKIFFTERSGVPYWMDRVEEHLFHQYDNPPKIAVLRFPKDDLDGYLSNDPLGTNDAREKAYFITYRVRPQNITSTD